MVTLSIESTQIGALLLLSILATQTSAMVLKDLPDNARVDSEVIAVTDSKVNAYSVEEFINRKEGSVRIDVLDRTEADQKPKSTTYYRIKEHKGDFTLFGSAIITYDEEALKCHQEQLEFWSLEQLTKILVDLQLSSDIDIEGIEDDRSLIGPITVLEIVYKNADKFILRSEAFDEIDLATTYFFTMDVKLRPSRSARLICLMPKYLVENQNEMKIGTTSLSQVKSAMYPTKVSVVYLDLSDNSSNLSPQDLFHFYTNKYSKLLINYKGIQELSISKHLGTSYGNGVVTSPFVLPIHAGCGLVSDHNTLYIKARHFSGYFRAKDFPDESFIAYDQKTNHLRIDSVGEHKIIYDLRLRRATMIVDSAMDGNNIEQNKTDASYMVQHGDRNHCTATFMNGREEDSSGLCDIDGLSDILGLGEDSGIMYLGTKTLEDGLQAHVFEREVTYRQVPVITRLHERIKRPQNSRYFLTFYFVSEISPTVVDFSDLFGEDAHESMWLRRIQLTSLSSLLLYPFLHSEITFSQFSWTVETLPLNEKVGAIVHPVRTFDIGVECKPLDGKFKLDYVITKDKNDGQNSSNDFYPSLDDEDANLNIEKRDSFEEAVMDFTARETGVSRSLINELELTWSTGGTVLVSAKLLRPIVHKYERTFVGWILSVNSVLVTKKATIVKERLAMSRSECALRLASLFSEASNTVMLYCPNFGCGYIQDLTQIDYLKNDQQKDPVSSDYPEICEIYKQNMNVDSSAMIGNRYTQRFFEQSLMDSRIAIDLDLMEETKNLVSDDKIYTAAVTKVSFTDMLIHNTLGIMLIPGICYTKDTTVSLPDGNATAKVSLVELEFEAHFSVNHCHEACRMYSFCHTYSFNSRQRICTLSDVIASRVKGTSSADSSRPTPFENLQDDSECALYTLNSIVLYKPAPYISWNSPSIYQEQGYYFAKISLEECANTCHAYEIGSENGFNCSHFSYASLRGLCAILDKDSYLFYKENSPDVDKETHYKGMLEPKDWYLTQQWLDYRRDFERFYATKESTKLTIEQPKEGSDSKETLLKVSTLYGLDEHKCLRECTMVNPDCVMVDHCFGTRERVSSEECTMYNVRSPFTVIRKDESKQDSNTLDKIELNEPERLFYNNTKSGANLITTKTSSCTHFYLTGSYLSLKRQIAIKDTQKGVKSLSDIAEEDLERSNSILDKMNNMAVVVSEHRFGILGAAFHILVGLCIGCALFIYGKDAKGFLSQRLNKTYLETLTSGLLERVRGTKRDRSESRVEFHELDGIEN